MVAGLLALAICAGCTTGAALAWSGHWRSWPHHVLWSAGATPITLLPGVAAGTLAGGLGALGAISPSSPLASGCFAVLVAGVVLFAVTPRWWGPSWYRGLDPAPKPDVGDPLTALAVAGLHASAGVDVPRSVSVGQPIERWRGSWISGDELQPAAHGLTHGGAVAGHLELHRAGVSFVASRTEDLLRGHPTVLTIASADLRDVRVVPRGAGVDGRPRAASGPRSAFARLAIDASDGAYLFEVQAAKRTAQRIRDELMRVRS